MKKLFILIALSLMSSGSMPLGEEFITIHIEQQRPCSCYDRVHEGTLHPEFAACGKAETHVGGTILEVGGSDVYHLDDGPQPFHRDGNSYSTIIRVRYLDNTPIEVLDETRIGPHWVFLLHNDRRARSVLVYVGDTADFIKLHCDTSESPVLCRRFKEA